MSSVQKFSLEAFNQSFQKKMLLNDGSLHRMFDCVQKNTVFIYLCLPCGISCSSSRNLWSHIIGKKHTWKMNFEPFCPNKISNHPYYVKHGNNHINANKACVLNGPSIVAINKPSNVVSNKLSIDTPNKTSVIATNKPSVVALNKQQLGITPNKQQLSITPNKSLVVATNMPSVVVPNKPSDVPNKPSVVPNKPSNVALNKQQLGINPNKSLVVATDMPSAVVPNKPSVVSPIKLFLIASNKSSLVATNKPSVVVTDTPTIVARNKPLVVATNMPSVIATDISSVVAIDKPSVDATDKPLVDTTNMPSVVVPNNSLVADTDKPSVIVTDTPLIVAPKKPLVVATDMPSVIATDISSVVATDKPSVDATDKPLVDATNMPLVVIPNKPLVDDTDKPSVIVTDTPLLVAPNKPLVDDTDKPSVIVTDTPLLVAPKKPLVVATDMPSVIATDISSVVATDKPSVDATDKPLVDATNMPLVVVPNKALVDDTDKPLVIVTDTPLLVAPNKPLVVASDMPSVIATDISSVIATDKPSVVATDKPSIVASNQPSTVTLNKPASPVLNKSSVVVCDDPEPPKVETPSQLEECLPIKGKSIVGLEYFLEIVGDKKDPTYFCALCKASSNSQTVLEHIQGFSHKLEYLSSHYPRPFRALQNIAGKHLQVGKVQVVENICSCIEKAYGRLRPLIVSSENFHENRDKYLKKIKDSKHFTDADGGSFEKLVDEEYIIMISKLSDDKNMKSTISFDDDECTYDSSSPASTFSDNEEQITEEKLDTFKLDNNEMDENRGEKYPTKDDKKNSPQKKIKMEVDSKNYIGNEGTHTLKDSPRISENGSQHDDSEIVDLTSVKYLSEREKWKEYHSKMKIMCNDVKSQRKFYENHPKLHPCYDVESRAFWTKRNQELKIENKDANSIDLKPEWLKFWSDKMMTIYNKDLTLQRQKILKDLDLPDAFDDLIVDYSNCALEKDPEKIDQEKFNGINREIDMLKDRGKSIEGRNQSVENPERNLDKKRQEMNQISREKFHVRNQSFGCLERNWDKRKQDNSRRSCERSRERNRRVESPERNWNKKRQEEYRRSRERNRIFEGLEWNRDKKKQEKIRRSHERSRERNRIVKSPERNWDNKRQEKNRSSREKSRERYRSVESPEKNWDKRKQQKNHRSQERSRSVESPKRNWDKKKQEWNRISQERTRERNQSIERRERNQNVESPDRNWDKRNHEKGQKRCRERSQSVENPEKKKNRRSQERPRSIRTPERNQYKRSQERDQINSSIDKNACNRDLEISLKRSLDSSLSLNQKDQKREFKRGKFVDEYESTFQLRKCDSPLPPHKEYNDESASESCSDIKRRWNLFNTKFTCYVNEAKKKYSDYEENPQLHPDYKDEYSEFMNRQNNELKNVNDVKIEWFKYWSKRIRDLQQENIDNKKQIMMKDFGLTLEQARELSDDTRKYDKSMSNDKKTLKLMDLDKLDVLTVLRHLITLENYLGCLGPKIVDLLSVVLKMEKEKQNSSNEILNVDEYCVLLETVKEKIKGQLLVDLIKSPVKEAAELSITYVDALLKKASVVGKMHIKLTQDEKPTQDFSKIAVSISIVEKAAIASEIIAVLMSQGKHDVTTEELETLINAVVGIANASQNPSVKPLSCPKLLTQLSEIRQNASQVKKSTNSASMLDIVKSPQDKQLMQSDTKIGDSWERNAPFVDKLSDSDLKTLLQNFRTLSTEEQQGLVRYLKQLNASNPTRVENLRKFIDVDTSTTVQLNKIGISLLLLQLT